MSFLFVDRIHSYEPQKSIRGLKNVTRNEAFFYWLPDGRRVLSPAVITEALAQLGAWLKMVSTDFTKRPVLLADELTSYHGLAVAGDQIDLQVDVLDFADDVVVTRSVASIEGKPIVDVKCCRGYLLPIEDFSDPMITRKMFQNLYRPELKSVQRVGQTGTKLGAYAGQRSFDGLMFIDGLIEHSPYKRVVGYKNFSSCEPYFADHFPLKPVVPGVLILTFMGEVCQFLIKEHLNMPLRARALIPTHIQNVRFRKFVEPGDQCVLTADIVEGDARGDAQQILVRATITANDKRVMQAEMGFVTMFGAESTALSSLTHATPAGKPQWLDNLAATSS